MSKLDELKSHLRKGNIYKRDELQKWSSSIDRHLCELTNNGILKKVGPGLYHFPKKNAFGFEPPADQLLIKKFLENDNFLITSFNSFNGLGLGTTQLYNQQIVYNHLRSGDIKLGNKLFSFRKKSAFPKKPTKEFLVVDLINNLDALAEDQTKILEKTLKKAMYLDQSSLSYAIEKYGTPKTRKLLAAV
ncbi:hypothetical protein [Pedobacter duraquae]|uniref:Uncharacterized protein n=1 Tax=Pedobacter duraquae TaxID=425511 RepID=A0A4R6IF57_9SPHI|nr:hypothetical protein [Pedobacter duraquae]TDO20963.1 hypothetical protein CLV32_3600 [Pedobacter duraquae]